MAKKIDIKRTLGKQQPPLSIEAVEEMTRLIHNKSEKAIISESDATTKATPVETPPVYESDIVETLNYEKTTALTNRKMGNEQTPPIEKGKRGRKPKNILETERLLRVSVDLPESVFIKLKIAVIQQQTDMKTYIRHLVDSAMNS